MIITDLNSPELQLYAKLNENFAKMIEIAKEEIKKPPITKKNIEFFLRDMKNRICNSDTVFCKQ